MNSTKDPSSPKDNFRDALVKNLVIVLLGTTINCINGTFVVTFFKNSVFYSDPRYILYIHLVINDMIMICVSVTLFILAYAWPFVYVPVCCMLLLIATATNKNTPLNLAAMAIERYIAICKPLHHSQICTVRRTYIVIYIIWSVGVMPGLADIFLNVAHRPISIFYSFIRCGTLTLYTTQYHALHSKIVQIIYMSFVWITLMYTYFRVLFTAKKATTDKVSAIKAQNTILLHGAQLLLCMLSYLTPILNRILGHLFPTYRINIHFSCYLITNILPRLLSPLIYGIRDQKLMKHMKGYFTCNWIFVKVESTKS